MRLIAAVALLVLVLLAPACSLLPGSELKLEGPTDIDMLHKVEAALKTNTYTKLTITITSEGGPVLSSLEIARVLRAASDRGQVIEIHAKVLCASGCTFVLASGTVGHRYIARESFFLVHPPQAGGGFGPVECVTWSDGFDVEGKVKNEILREMLTSYMVLTGRSESVVKDWLTCGHERVGGGELALLLGMADRLE